LGTTATTSAPIPMTKLPFITNPPFIRQPRLRCRAWFARVKKGRRGAFDVTDRQVVRVAVSGGDMLCSANYGRNHDLRGYGSPPAAGGAKGQRRLDAGGRGRLPRRPPGQRQPVGAG